MVARMRTTRWSTLRAALSGAALLLAALAAFAPSRAEARGPMYAGFGLGPHWYLDCDGCRAHFRPQFEFGIHFSRNDTGFFIAFEAVPTFGDDYIMFFGGVRLGGDIEVWGNRDIAFILRPSGLFGGGYTEFYGRPDVDWGFFVLQPAFDLRLAVADRLMHIWLRPVGFDLYFIPERPGDHRFEFDAGYAFMAGLDFNF